MSGQQIIMNFSMPPSLEDVSVMAQGVVDTLPEELLELVDDLVLQIEDFPDEAIEQELDLDDPYELLALYRDGREISPGVEKKSATEDSVLIIFRRALLDLWCEECVDLYGLLRQAMIEELARAFEFSDEDAADMVAQHHQGLL